MDNEVLKQRTMNLIKKTDFSNSESISSLLTEFYLLGWNDGRDAVLKVTEGVIGDKMKTLSKDLGDLIYKCYR